MGLELPHPVIASASPLTKDADAFKRLEDANAAAVVMFSLFEEQLIWERESLHYLTEMAADSFPEATSYFPPVQRFQVGPDRYLELIRRATESVRIPIIASLNGVTREGWVDYARQIQQAGAAGLELNVYHIPSGLGESGPPVWRPSDKEPDQGRGSRLPCFFSQAVRQAFAMILFKGAGL